MGLNVSKQLIYCAITFTGGWYEGWCRAAVRWQKTERLRAGGRGFWDVCAGCGLRDIQHQKGKGKRRAGKCTVGEAMEKYHTGEKELEEEKYRMSGDYGICQCGKYFKKDYEDRDA